MRKNNEILKFIVVGGSAVLIDFITYFLLKMVLSYSFAKAIGFIAGALFAYILNKNWTFTSNHSSTYGLGKFVSLYLFSLGMNVLTNEAALFLWPSQIFFAFIIATGISTVINFLGQKFWVFKKS